MNQVLRIAEWNKHFECSQSRNLKKMAWVPIRVNLAGDGYTELLAHGNGPAHFGLWIALVEVAALCEPRGVLVRGNGQPHDADSLSRITRIPAKIVAEAIPRLINLRWLEYAAMLPKQGDPGILQDTVAPQRNFVATDRTDITGQDRQDLCAPDGARVVDSVSGLSIDNRPFETTEPEARVPSEPKPARKDTDGLTSEQTLWFEQVWRAYWRRVGRKPARRAFGKVITTPEMFGRVLDAIQSQTPEMLSREPAHRPHFATWLNQERWTDESAAPVTTVKRDAIGGAIDEAMKLLR